MVSFLIAGLFGGILRGLVGIIKYSNSYKNVEIRPRYFAGMVAVSGVVGITTAWVIHDLGAEFIGLEKITPAMALVAGYAGGDLLENIYKILTRKESLF